LLSKIIKEKVIEKLDHRNINLEVDFMQGKMASTEILAIGIWNEIANEIHELGCKLHSIKLFETENNFVEYFGN
jgi:6-pyruvoyltetrahydropterin/6-carboxytetrahydropterin synthase